MSAFNGWTRVTITPHGETPEERYKSACRQMDDACRRLKGRLASLRPPVDVFARNEYDKARECSKTGQPFTVDIEIPV